MTSTESIERLRDVLNKLNDRDREFGSSLVSQFDRRGDLSDKQWPWVQRLIDKTKPAESFSGGQAGEFLALADFINRAAKHPTTNPKGLVHPKIRFDLSGIDECWRGDLLLKRAGDNARYPGSINVTNGMPFGDPAGEFYGRIHKDGRFEEGRDCNATVRGVLIALNADPASLAAGYGKKTGNCCFCNTPLSDDRSTSVGYGPICAERYCLPWG
jgi:hypothetical protein